jgi:hypothetical protein
MITKYKLAQMIKIEVHIPDGALDIEIKKNDDQYFLVVVLSKSSYFKENGRAWNGKIRKDEVQEITDLIKECYKKPSLPKRITINDGRLIKISLKDHQSKISLTIKDSFEEGKIEIRLMEKVFSRINEIIQDEILKKHTVVFGNSGHS